MLPRMEGSLRQQAVLRQIVERAAAIDAIEGMILIGSFAGGRPDAFSDLDLIAVVADGRLDEAWDDRELVAGDVFLIWEPHADDCADIRWLNWLTHDLVKVECGFAAPGSRDLAEPFLVVLGSPELQDRFPHVDRRVLEERAARRREEQQDFDPGALSPEERLGWKLSELKDAARAFQRHRSSRP